MYNKKINEYRKLSLIQADGENNEDYAIRCMSRWNSAVDNEWTIVSWTQKQAHVKYTLGRRYKTEAVIVKFEKEIL